MRLLIPRAAAVFFALTWLLFPGFGLPDLGVSWDAGWPVVLEASWGLFMTVLVGGSFLAVAVRPRRAAPAVVTLGVALGTMIVAVAAGLEPWLLVHVAVLVVEMAALHVLLPEHEPLGPVRVETSWPLLALALVGAGPWFVHAEAMFRGGRAGWGLNVGDATNNVDHYSLQGALALAMVALPLLAACWPRGRRHLGVSAGLCAGYLGLVSYAFPGAWAGLSPTWSLLCLLWGVALSGLALVPGSQRSEFGGEVVEAERAL